MDRQELTLKKCDPVFELSPGFNGLDGLSYWLVVWVTGKCGILGVPILVTIFKLSLERVCPPPKCRWTGAEGHAEGPFSLDFRLPGTPV